MVHEMAINIPVGKCHLINLVANTSSGPDLTQPVSVSLSPNNTNIVARMNPSDPRQLGILATGLTAPASPNGVGVVATIGGVSLTTVVAGITPPPPTITSITSSDSGETDPPSWLTA